MWHGGNQVWPVSFWKIHGNGTMVPNWLRFRNIWDGMLIDQQVWLCTKGWTGAALFWGALGVGNLLGLWPVEIADTGHFYEQTILATPR